MSRRYARRSLHTTSGTPLRIAWASDSHIIAAVDGDPNAEGAVDGTLYFWKAADRLRRFVVHANETGADFALHTGDMVDFYDPYNAALFMNIWGDLTVPNAYTLGNHDLYRIAEQGGYEAVQSAFGRDNAPEVAGSRFQQAVSLDNGEVAARLLVLDSTMSNSGPSEDYAGFLSDAALAWIEDELENADEDVVLLASHQGPHIHMNPTTRADLVGIVEAAVAARPSLRVYYLFGHQHVNISVIRFENLGQRLPGFLNTSLVDYEVAGRYSFFEIRPDRSVKAVPFAADGAN